MTLAAFTPTSDLLGVDGDGRVTRARAAALYAAGVRFIVRYVGIEANGAEDLDAAEAEDICGEGHVLYVVQHALSPGWIPSAALGAKMGAAAARNALAAGYPLSSHVFADIEGVGGTDVATIAWEGQWSGGVLAAALGAGGYFGDRVPLTPLQKWKLRLNRYWRAPIPSLDVAFRGFGIDQLWPFDQRIAGGDFDLDVMRADRLGNYPTGAALAGVVRMAPPPPARAVEDLPTVPVTPAEIAQLRASTRE